MDIAGLKQRIRQQLVAHDLSERGASLAAGLSDSYVRNILCGKSQNPTSEKLQKLAAVLHCDYKWLATGAGSPATAIEDPDEEELILSFRSLPESQRKQALAVFRALASSTSPSKAS